MVDFLKNVKVQILLATYNGEKYIAELLDSLLNQTYQDWQLLVYDDGSGDDTLKIIRNYQMEYPQKIVLLSSTNVNKGSTGSFYHLLDHTTAKYAMFCDQDDIWLPDKIKISINSIDQLEKKTGDKFCLVFSDLVIVDEKLNQISKSYWEFSQIDPSHCKYTESLIANSIVNGNTIILNANFKNLLKNRPSFIQHDQWLSILASHYGSISYINKQLILYRQHGSNEVGSLKVGFKYLFKKSITIRKSISFIKMTCKELPFEVNLLTVFYYKLNFNLKRKLL